MPSFVTSAESISYGYYAPASFDILKRDKSIQIYESYMYTLIEHRVSSNFPDYIWKVQEGRFEDSSSTSVIGPEGAIFDMAEGGAYWGYHNGKANFSFFVLDGSVLRLGLEYQVQNFSQIDYLYQALVVNAGSMKSYDCVFKASRFQDARSIRMANQKIDYDAANEHIFIGISKFLSWNGVDLVMDHCKENLQYLGDMARDYNKERLVGTDYQSDEN